MKITHKLLFSSCLLLGVTVAPSQVLAGPFVPQGPFVKPGGPIPPFPYQVTGKEYTDNPDKNGYLGDNNPLNHTPNPGQVIAWDGNLGGTKNTTNFLALWQNGTPPDPFQIDALANVRDSLFKEVVANEAELLISTGIPTQHTSRDNYVLMETRKPVYTNWADPFTIDQDPPHNVDALEVWGPINPNAPLEERINPQPDPVTGKYNSTGTEGVDDANRYSLLGDPVVNNVKCSVFTSTGNCYITALELLTAITHPSLQLPGPISLDKFDLDGLMVYDTIGPLGTFDYDPVNNIGDRVLFSIMPIDVNGDGIITPDDPALDIDGGEIFHWEKGQTSATFLNHGGHDWNTPFPVRLKFITGSENVDALEAVADDKTVPEPSTVLSLLTLGTLGAASTLKRKLKSSKSDKN